MQTIKEVSFDTILNIWQNRLWPNRSSAIESHSAMIYLNGRYNIQNMTQPVWFLGCYVNDKLVGVNSGHMCADGSFRSRGLWVDPEFRKLGLGQYLLLNTIEIAKQQNSNFIWSYPRRISWTTYSRVGFERTSDWDASETSDANAYCIIKLRE